MQLLPVMLNSADAGFTNPVIIRSSVPLLVTLMAFCEVSPTKVSGKFTGDGLALRTGPVKICSIASADILTWGFPPSDSMIKHLLKLPPSEGLNLTVRAIEAPGTRSSVSPSAGGVNSSGSPSNWKGEMSLLRGAGAPLQSRFTLISSILSILSPVLLTLNDWVADWPTETEDRHTPGFRISSKQSRSGGERAVSSIFKRVMEDCSRVKIWSKTSEPHGFAPVPLPPVVLQVLLSAFLASFQTARNLSCEIIIRDCGVKLIAGLGEYGKVEAPQGAFSVNLLAVYVQVFKGKTAVSAVLPGNKEPLVDAVVRDKGFRLRRICNIRIIYSITVSVLKTDQMVYVVKSAA